MSQRRQRLCRIGGPLIGGHEAEFTDGPTVLPAPWSPPPDPDFRTGTMPRLERADLSGGLHPGLEPSDSSQLTTRFSRDELQALIGVRMQTSLRAPRATVAEAPGLAPRALPPVDRTSPPRAALRRLLGYHGPLLHLTIAFTLGVLTGILAMR